MLKSRLSLLVAGRVDWFVALGVEVVDVGAQVGEVVVDLLLRGEAGGRGLGVLILQALALVVGVLRLVQEPARE